MWAGSVDDGRDICQCADGGFFFTGRSNTWAEGGFAYNPYDYQVFLVKVDANGNYEWTRNFGQSGCFLYGGDVFGYYDAAWSICATPDSGCLIAGKSQSPNYCDPWEGMPEDCIGDDNLLLVRVDKDGDTLWTKGIGGQYFDRGWCIQPIPGTSDFYVVGQTCTYGPATPSPDQANIWLLRIDSLGNMLHTNGWGIIGAGDADSRWCCVAPDGGCVLVGFYDRRDTSYFYEPYDSVITHEQCQAVFIKADAECNEVWQKVYDRSYFHYCRGITNTLDGGFLAITYDQYPNRTWALRLDENGDTLWTKHLALDSTGTGVVANFTMVVQGPDSGFYFAGSGGGKARILHTDQNCDEIWHFENDFGGQSEYYASCIMTEDSGCCAVGVTYSIGPSVYQDLFASRIDRWGNDYSGIGESKSIIPDELVMTAYPNPFNSSVYIDFTEMGIEQSKIETINVDIFNIAGEKVAELIDSEKIWTPGEHIPTGTYLLRAKTNKTIVTRKVIYLK